MGTQNRGFVAAMVLTGLLAMAVQSSALARDDHSHAQSGPQSNFATSNKSGGAAATQAKIKQQPTGVNRSAAPSNRMLTSSKSFSRKAQQYKNYTQDKNDSKAKNSNNSNAKQQGVDQKRDQLQKEADKRQEKAERDSGSGGGGAATGAVVGGAVGGPVGAAAGAIIGGSSGGGSQDERKENAPKDADDKLDKRPDKEPRLPDDHRKLKAVTGVSGASSQDVRRTRNCTNC